MSKWGLVLLFVTGAVLSWGVYVPVVHIAAQKLGSNLRAFLFVGVAYFLVAVLVPGIIIFVLRTDPTEKAGVNFNGGPVMWGIAAGIVGAIGALCVIFAVTEAARIGGRGAAIYIAPLVFAGAPIMNTIATMTVFHPTRTTPDYRFFLGLAMAAGGAVMVMLFKPVDKPQPAAPQTAAAPADAGESAPARES